jgi:hypothetical protein
MGSGGSSSSTKQGSSEKLMPHRSPGSTAADTQSQRVRHE